MEENTNAAAKACNYRQPTKCRLDGICPSSCTIYKPTANSVKEQVLYIEMISINIKDNHKKYENETELSKYIWKFGMKIQNLISLGK